MRIEQIMTKDVCTCTPETSMHDAARLMWEHDCGSLPVVRGEGTSELAGVITDRDICMAACHQGKPLGEMRVAEAMATKTVSCSPEDDVQRAQEAMSEHQIRRLPVVDGEGRLVGLVTLAKLARLAGDGRSSKGLGADKIGQTLAGISQPRKEASATRAS